VNTTTHEPASTRHPDLVNRDFTAVARNQLAVSILTFAGAWTGVASECFIIGVLCRIVVSCLVTSHIEMARWSRAQNLPGL